MGSAISTSMLKCEFTIYKGVSEHKCEKNKKSKYSTFYEFNKACKTDDLDVLEDPENFKKRRIRVQVDCNCEKTVRLSILNQIAKSIDFNPGMVYNYTDKTEIKTDYGFVWWLYENTCEIRKQSNEIDLFVSSLIPGITFYQGEYMNYIAEDFSPFSAQQQRSQPLANRKYEDHRCNFLKLIQLSADLPAGDSVVVIEIIRA